MLAEEARQVAAADFFLAFNDEVKIDRQFPCSSIVSAIPENVAEDLTLVVRGAPGKDVTVFQNRIERGDSQSSSGSGGWTS